MTNSLQLPSTHCQSSFSWVWIREKKKLLWGEKERRYVWSRCHKHDPQTHALLVTDERERRVNDCASNVNVHIALKHNQHRTVSYQSKQETSSKNAACIKTRRDWCSYQLMCIKCSLTQTIRAPRLPTFIWCSSELGLIDIAGMNGSQLVCNL